MSIDVQVEMLVRQLRYVTEVQERSLGWKCKSERHQHLCRQEDECDHQKNEYGFKIYESQKQTQRHQLLRSQGEEKNETKR